MNAFKQDRKLELITRGPAGQVWGAQENYKINRKNNLVYNISNKFI